MECVLNEEANFHKSFRNPSSASLDVPLQCSQQLLTDLTHTCHWIKAFAALVCIHLGNSLGWASCAIALGATLVGAPELQPHLHRVHVPAAEVAPQLCFCSSIQVYAHHSIAVRAAARTGRPCCGGGSRSTGHSKTVPSCRLKDAHRHLHLDLRTSGPSRSQWPLDLGCDYDRINPVSIAALSYGGGVIRLIRRSHPCITRAWSPC